jgi:O-antigen/teichoic acid export membrane protein
MIYGTAYAGSEKALMILIWTSLFIFPNFILLNLIIVLNKQKLNMIFSFSCLLLNVILNIFLIPHYGFIGASYATVATDMLLFVLAASFAMKYFNDFGFIKGSLKPILSGIASAIILIPLHDLNIFVMLSVIILSYSTFLFASKTLTFEEIRQFKKVFIRS